MCIHSERGERERPSCCTRKASTCLKDTRKKREVRREKEREREKAPLRHTIHRLLHVLLSLALLSKGVPLKRRKQPPTRRSQHEKNETIEGNAKKAKVVAGVQWLMSALLTPRARLMLMPSRLVATVIQRHLPTERTDQLVVRSAGAQHQKKKAKHLTYMCTHHTVTQNDPFVTVLHIRLYFFCFLFSL